MTTAPSLALYPSLLGPAWERLDERLRRAHARGQAQGRGIFRIQRGRGLLARTLAGLLRFPRDGDSVPTCLVVASQPCYGASHEIWQRDFGGRKLVSRQYPCRDGLLGERFGCLELHLRLEASGGALLFRSAGSALVFGSLRVRLPAKLSPRVNARVSAEDGAACRLAVEVEVAAPLAGALLRYQGYLDMEEAQS